MHLICPIQHVVAKNYSETAEASKQQSSSVIILQKARSRSPKLLALQVEAAAFKGHMGSEKNGKSTQPSSQLLGNAYRLDVGGIIVSGNLSGDKKKRKKPVI